ncbi:MAG: putative toxin-antitoxin system toxin component, PIN family [Desulfobacterales bacterium]
MKIVLDTNVFISGVFFAGPPHEVLKAWRDGRIQILISKKIIEEYRRVGVLLSKQFPDIEFAPVLQLLAIHAEFVQPKKMTAQVCEDPDDDKFLECALSGKSNLIVSGDKHLLKISGHKGIVIVNPRNFVDNYLK